MHSDAACFDVDLPVNHLVLPGTLAVPQRPLGLVLFAHGSGSGRLSPRNRRVAELLHSASLATLLFDLLTPAEEAWDRSHGDLRFDIDRLAGRLLATADWARRTLPELPLGYFGASTGAAAALVAGARQPTWVRAIVSRGGRPDLAGGVLPAVLAPTLLMVGDADPLMLECNRSALGRLRGVAELQVVPGAGHLCEEPGALELVAREAAGWLARFLPAGGEVAEQAPVLELAAAP